MKRLKSIASLLLIALLILNAFSVTAFATERKAARMSSEGLFGYMHTPRIGSHALTDAYLRGEGAHTNSTRAAEAPLPSHYDSRDYGYVTSVKNQNPYGTCWTFAATASIESNMIKQGLINPDTNAPTNTSIDLSEYHLAWFSFTNSYDAMGMINADSSEPNGSNYLNQGGNGMLATHTLMRWEGPASEHTSALAYSRVSTSGLSSSYAYNYNSVHVEDAIWIPGDNIDAIKRAIMEYGAGSINYYHNTTYLNNRTNALCFKQTVSQSSSSFCWPNHAVTLVGWDDNYPKSNFNAAYGPSNDGAWIIKNSWGSSVFDQGYFYLSYEDSSALSDSCYFFKVASTDNYDYNYQYDGTSNFVSYLAATNGTQIANVFTANGSETLKAVALNVFDEGVSYTLDVYRNPVSASNPTSGEKVATQTGALEFPGYFTIPLNTPVHLAAGDRFAVVFTLSAPADASGNTGIHIPYDATASISWMKWTHANRGDTSFYRNAGGAWTDCPNNGDFRIKAYTDDYVYTVTYSVSAASNNNAYGTVSVSGSDIIAVPAAGYYVSGCEILDGSASYTIDGNTIHVTPFSDCTVRVIFAPMPTYTVSFNSCGVNVGSHSVTVNGQITLPTAVPQTPEGWSFCGWVSQPVAETSAKPSFYAPGARYTVQSDSVLYALFTRSEGNSEVGFQRLTSAPETWVGNYVITNSNATRVLMGVSTASTYMSTPTCAPTLTSTGATLNENLLTNVHPVYQFSVTAHGNSYWIQNVSIGSYVGASSAALYALTQNSATMLNWSVSFQNGAPQLCNLKNGYALSFNGSYFQMSSGTSTSISLWKEAPVGCTYYSTEFISESHTHTLTYAPAAAPTCAEAGHSAYYFCEGCGKYFSDANAQNEIALSSTVIPATGNHSFGSWVSNHLGAHERVCAVCGTKQSVPCTYTDVVTPPTTTDQGYTTHTCTVCGYYYVDSFTPPIVDDYVITFSVPNGVAPVASMTCQPNAAITLPTAGAPAGYTFLGWVHTAVSPTASTPGNIMTGAYQPAGDTTLYALYSSPEGNSELGFQRLTSAPDTWEGNYVITYSSNANTMRVLMGVSTSYMYMSNQTCAPTLAATGATLNGNLLTNVNPVYQFSFTAHGSSYWIQNVSTGSYVGASGAALYAVTQRSTSMLNWAPSFQNGTPQLRNLSRNYYLSFNGAYFQTTSGTSTNICLWKEMPSGTTYYTTTIH